MSTIEILRLEVLVGSELIFSFLVEVILMFLLLQNGVLVYVVVSLF